MSVRSCYYLGLKLHAANVGLVHGYDQHHRQSSQKHTRNQFEEERLDPVVELEQEPAVAVNDRVEAEVIGGHRRVGDRLVVQLRRTCVRGVVFLHYHRDLQVKKARN